MEDINVAQLKAKIDNKEDIILIDVREPHEYQAFNIGAKLVPLGTLPHFISDLDPEESREIIIHCRSGQRSAAAKDFMIKQGFENVRNVLGGMLAWQEMQGK